MRTPRTTRLRHPPTRSVTRLRGRGSCGPPQSLLPLGRFRAPHGRLVPEGRRGHYTFCDELRACDLDSGAAYLDANRSALAFRADRSVDGVATERARRRERRQGTLPIDALREAAVAILLSSHMQDDAIPFGVSLAMPAGLDPELPAQRPMHGVTE